MLYQIDDKYYMLRNREYIMVDVSLNGNELSIKPKRDKGIIEKNDKVKVKGVLIENVIKDLKEPKKSKDTLLGDTDSRNYNR